MAETELLIRAAELSDIPSIMELEQGSIAHPWTKSALEDLIKDPNKICCVGESDGKVVCYAGVETVLDGHGIFFDKTEVWIESERLYEVLYSFELEV